MKRGETTYGYWKYFHHIFKIFQITLFISVVLFIWKKVNRPEFSPTKKEVSLGTLGTVQAWGCFCLLSTLTDAANSQRSHTFISHRNPQPQDLWTTARQTPDAHHLLIFLSRWWDYDFSQIIFNFLSVFCARWVFFGQWAGSSLYSKKKKNSQFLNSKCCYSSA